MARSRRSYISRVGTLTTLAATGMAGCLSGTEGGGGNGSDGTSTDGQSSESISLRVGSFLPMDAFNSSRFLFPPWAKSVNNKLEGYEIEFQFDGANAIGGPGELYDLAGDGVVDIAFDTPAAQGGKMVLNTFMALPTLYGSGRDEHQAANLALHELVTPGGDGTNAIYEEFTNLGVRPLMTATPSPYQLVTNGDVVTSMDQLSGLVCRASGGTKADIVEALGMSAADVQAPDIYSAHQQGTLTADMLNPAAIWSNSWYEVMNYCTLNLSLGGFNMPWVISEQTYQSLPSDVTDAMVEAGNETAGKYADRFYSAVEKDIIGSEHMPTEKPIDKGSQTLLYDSTAEEEIVNAVEPVIDGWIQDKENNGLPAQEVVDDFRSLYDDNLSTS